MTYLSHGPTWSRGGGANNAIGRDQKNAKILRYYAILCNSMRYCATFCENSPKFLVYRRDFEEKKIRDRPQKKEFLILLVIWPHRNRIRPATTVIMIMRAKILFSRKNKNVCSSFFASWRKVLDLKSISPQIAVLDRNSKTFSGIWRHFWATQKHVECWLEEKE